MNKKASPPKDKKELPVISRETQIEMMRFFLKTSVPKMLKNKEKKFFNWMEDRLWTIWNTKK